MKFNAISEEVKSLFYYDESSPSCLRWKVSILRGVKNGLGGNPVVHAGDIAGTLQHGKYYRVKVNTTLLACSRIVYSMFNSRDMDGLFIDHIDGDSLNNRISNLRLVSRQANNRNRRKSKNNTSGKVGVYFNRQICKGKHDYTYAIACVVDERSGKRLHKAFAVHKLGLMPAFAAACNWRDSKIREMNLLGAGYTDRHIF